MVTLNHRLGAFGYLYLHEIFGEECAASGVAGMLDLALALEWIRDNIAAFGGDPQQVALFGTSGGGAKIMTSLAMPAFEGLYRGGLIISGHDLWKRNSVETAHRASLALLQKLGVKLPDPSKLCETPVETILKAHLHFTRVCVSVGRALRRRCALGSRQPS